MSSQDDLLIRFDSPEVVDNDVHPVVKKEVHFASSTTSNGFHDEEEIDEDDDVSYEMGPEVTYDVNEEEDDDEPERGSTPVLLTVIDKPEMTNDIPNNHNKSDNSSDLDSLTEPEVTVTSSGGDPDALDSGYEDQTRSEGNIGVESLIAAEIRELRQRELELQHMRHALTSPDSSSAPTPSSDVAISCSEDDASLLDTPSPSDLRAFSPITGSYDVTSCSPLPTSPLTTAFPFGPPKSSRIKVRPLSDGDQFDTMVQSPSDGESPVEREIRIARQRELELKLERQRLQSTPSSNGSPASSISSRQSPDVSSHSKPSPPSQPLTNGESPRAKSPSSANGAFSLATFKGNTQRFLAAMRIQQEIEEHTAREVALKDTGNIRTISQDSVDAKVQWTANGDSPKTNPWTVNGDGAKSPEIPVFENGAGENEQLKVTRSQSNPINGQSPPTNGVAPPTKNGGLSLYTRRLSAGHLAGNKTISMQKFIASKGKEIAFVHSKSSSNLVVPPDRNGIPQHTNGEAKAPKTYCRRGSQSTDVRIQEELKEMKTREEELRKERYRLLGQSHPNLTSLDTSDNDHQVDGVTHNGGEFPTLRERINSNPNLLDDNDTPSHKNSNNNKDPKQDVPVGGPRRRSALIDQWEQRIQSS